MNNEEEILFSGETKPDSDGECSASDNSDNESSDDGDKRTLYCGNLSDRVTEELFYELFLQAGPIDDIVIPTESETKRQKPFGFITYSHKCSIPYALKLFEGVALFNRTLNIKPRDRNANKSNNSNNAARSADNNSINQKSNFGNNSNNVLRGINKMPVPMEQINSLNPTIPMLMDQQIIPPVTPCPFTMQLLTNLSNNGLGLNPFNNLVLQHIQTLIQNQPLNNAQYPQPGPSNSNTVLEPPNNDYFANINDLPKDDYFADVFNRRDEDIRMDNNNSRSSRSNYGKDSRRDNYRRDDYRRDNYHRMDDRRYNDRRHNSKPYDRPRDKHHNRHQDRHSNQRRRR